MIKRPEPNRKVTLNSFQHLVCILSAFSSGTLHLHPCLPAGRQRTNASCWMLVSFGTRGRQNETFGKNLFLYRSQLIPPHMRKLAEEDGGSD